MPLNKETKPNLRLWILIFKGSKEALTTRKISTTQFANLFLIIWFRGLVGWFYGKPTGIIQ